MRYILSAAGLVLLLVTVFPVEAGPAPDSSGSELQFQLPKLPGIGGGGGQRRPQQQQRRPGFPGQQQNMQPKLVTIGSNYDIPITDDIHVRTLKLAEKFDDKGNIIDVTRLSQAEQARLKGSAEEQRLPGYKADLLDLKPGQTIELYLIRKVTITPKTPAKESEGEQAETPKAAPAAPRAPVSVTGSTRVAGKLVSVAPNQVTIRVETQVLQYPNAPAPAQPKQPAANTAVKDKAANVAVIIESPAVADTKNKQQPRKKGG